MSDKDKSQPTVLIIDDDEVNRIVLEKLFHRENIISSLAKNGREGMIMAKKIMPDIILLDIFMPDENGFKILANLKNDPDLEKIPVCIFSILEDEEKIKKAHQMGACAYITKPFDMKETVTRVKQILTKCIAIDDTSR
ncbi:hypothetical protein MTBBW1_730016 [Desulfamplus magnetovallimortis]|uniref:Response regulatory domain-containing protein n=1 Tax=Desulfamplus magnetovallimortis TaxID=1246637 RepID=A0A1W1HJ37_9BACT|nr:response regulator [Desulfamplus magnetovallimortis]SLM32463.1 hypothetical protein MTBBW1_730016 [Desulfamplus magnetovallimortis]